MKKLLICLVTLFVGTTAIAIAANNTSAATTTTENVVVNDVDADGISIYTYTKCTTCNGKGYTSLIKKKCSCLGAGCSKCGGDGYIEIRNTCTTCNGTGKMKVKKM